jgi:hypothetical protein
VARGEHGAQAGRTWLVGSPASLPVFARRPSGLSPAVEMRAGQSVTAIGAAAMAEAAAASTAARHRAIVRRPRLAPVIISRPHPGRGVAPRIAVALAGLVVAVGAGLGIVAGTASPPVPCWTRRARPARRRPGPRARQRGRRFVERRHPSDETEAAATCPWSPPARRAIADF